MGRFSYHRPRSVIGAWLVLIAVVAGVLAMNPPRLSNEMRIDGSPAQQVIDDLGVRMPVLAGGQGLIAFDAPAGQRIDDGANGTALLRAVDAISRSPHVIDGRALARAELAKGPASATLAGSAAIAKAQLAVPPPAAGPHPITVNGQPVPGVVVSADNTTALVQFQFDKQTAELPTGTVEQTVDAARDALADTGIAVLPSASMLQMPDLIGGGEVIGLLVAAVVLAITLGSMVAAGLPLATALASVTVGVSGTFLFSHLVHLQSITAVLALMLGLAVGIDYAMFIVNRQRRLMIDQGLPASEAAPRAVGTAGSAVLFAGTTVVIALVALTVVRISLLTPMALAAAATVSIAVFASLTLLPALLGLAGNRIGPKPARHAKSTTDGNSKHRFARAWMGAVLKRPTAVTFTALVIAGVIALPALGMSLGLPAGSSYNEGTPQRQSYELVASHYDAGYNGPLVVVTTPKAARDKLSTAQLVDTYQGLRRMPGVKGVNLQMVNDADDTAVFYVIPGTGPTDDATAQLVRDIRAGAGTLAEVRGVHLGVTGVTAIGIDTSERLSHAVPMYVGIVVGLSLLLLLAVFGSIAVPVKATLGFLLSVVATFGATTALFQWGWLQQLLGLSATGPIVSLLPVIVIGVLYGLAMDYEVFLVSSMKEAHVHGHRGDDAVITGFTQSSRVVTAAAVIMMAVFAGFVFNVDPMIKQIGFALAFGVLIDAFVVRMTVVPAVMSMLGERAWWLPKRLERVLPDLDIEGDKLTRTLGAATQPGSDRHAVVTV
jgi:RND superfamily putative drug exporter